MVTWVRRGSVVAFVSALLPVVSGVAAANPVSQVKDVDGYRVTLSIDDVNIQSVPNMAAAPLVREGFVTATSTLAISCTPSAGSENKECDKLAPAVTELDVKAQVGCPMDLSSGTSVSLSPQISGSLPVQDVLQAILPPAPTPTPNDITDIGLLPTGQIAPQVGVKLLPGYIRNVPLGNVRNPPVDAQLSALSESMSLGATANLLQSDATVQDARPNKNLVDRAAAAISSAISVPLVISVRNFHLEVDQTETSLAVCGGVVAVRIYAQAKVITSKSFDTVDIYGDIFTI